MLHKNKREQNGLTRSILHTLKRAEWYKSLNPKEKGKILSGRAEWYKTLDLADKDKIISQVQANKEVHRSSIQHDLDDKITAFQSKIREGSYYICSVCNRILYRKTVKQTNVQHSARTIYWVVYPWFLSVLEWPITYRLMTTFFEIGVCPWPDLSSLFQYTSPTPIISLHLIPSIQYRPGIPVTLLKGYSSN